MRNLKEKKGISLIVLVITIIVMIILAAAIILSISNSGIMDKAGKAKKNSDRATLKEYVSVLESEWELMTTEERNATGNADSREYVNEKLYDKGYTDVALSVDEELYIGLNANARKAIADGLAIGDIIYGYAPTLNIATTSGKENTAPNAKEGGEVVEEQIDTPQEVYRTEFSVWRFFGISDDGEIKIAPDMTSDAETMKISGKGGYIYGPEELNKVCNTLYSIENVGVARCINLKDIDDILGIDEEYREVYGYIDYTVEGYAVINSVPTTIGQILEKKGMSSLKNTETPDGKDINTYIPVINTISKGSKYIKYQERKSLVYMDKWYFTTNREIYGGFDVDLDVFWFCVTIVDNSDGKLMVPFSSDGTSMSSSNQFGSRLAIRPIVCLDASVPIKTIEGKWSI